MASVTNDQVLQEILNKRYGNKAAEKPAPKKEVEFLDIEEEAISYDSGKYKLYSECFGWDNVVLANKPDFMVRVYSDDDWDESGKISIPEWDRFREVDHVSFYPFVLSLQEKGRLQDKIIPMLVGHTGSGKTSGVEYYCSVVRQPLLVINSRADMESDEILGRPWSKGSGAGMEYLLGSWPKATEKGWVVLWDEWTKALGGIVMAAQRHMEGRFNWHIEGIPGELADKHIKADPRYRLVLADNDVGTGALSDLYGATNIQDSSTLNRVGVIIPVNYMSEDKEVALLTRKFPFIPKNKAHQMIKMLNFIRHGFDTRELSAPASMRNVEKWAELAYDVRSYEAAFTWVMLRRFAEDAERQAVTSQYFTIFGKELTNA